MRADRTSSVIAERVWVAATLSHASCYETPWPLNFDLPAVICGTETHVGAERDSGAPTERSPEPRSNMPAGADRIPDGADSESLELVDEDLKSVDNRRPAATPYRSREPDAHAAHVTITSVRARPCD
jgi:hypothetical protein